MLRRTGLRVLVLLFLLSALATPAVAAGPHVESPSFLGTLWHALTSLFAPEPSRAKNGSIMDPNGQPTTGGACSDRRAFSYPSSRSAA